MLNNESYGYLLSPHIQIVDMNGDPMTGAFLKVFEAGSTYTQVTTYSDWGGTVQEANKVLDSRGEVVIIASNTISYKVMLCDSNRPVSNPYWVLDNVNIYSSSVLPGSITITVNGTTGQIDSVLTIDGEGNKTYTESLSADFLSRISTIESNVSTNTTNITTINNNLGDIDTLLNTLIPGEKDARSFPLSITETHYLKICDVDTDGTIPYHIDFLLYLSKNQLSLKFDEDVQGLMGTGTGSFKYLGQSCNPVFVYDVTPNTGRIVIFRTTPSAGKVSFFLVSYNGYELTNETVSIIDGHISGTTAIYSTDAYTTVAPTMGSNSETIYLTHNIRVGTSCSGLGTYYSPIEAKATQVTSTDETVEITTTVDNGVTTHDLSVTGGQVDTYKAMCSIGDTPGYLQNKLVGSTWLDVVEIPLGADEKNLLFALKNPDFFVKGNTIHGGTVVGVIGDLNEQTHSGYYTCYHSTLNAPPAQAGNPSWFIHHMNSNTANYYAVQIAYAYTTSIICYERTKVAGVWQAWTLRSSGSASNEVAHINTGDSLGAKDIIQLQAGSSTQWSAHGTMCSTIGAITPSVLSKMGFITTQTVTGNFIIAAYKVETSLAHSLICSTGITAFSSAGWISADVTNLIKAIAANDRVYLVIFTDCNGIAIAGASTVNFNIQPYVAGIKTNMGVLTEAPSTLTFESETTNRPFIYLTK